MLGKRIANARQQINLSQKELGEMIGVSQGLLSHYEQERAEPSIDTIVKIANACKVTLDWLIGGTDVVFNPPITIIDDPKALYFTDKSIGNFFPVVAKVTAGDLQLFEGNIVEEVFMGYQSKNSNFAVLVEGDSMDGGTGPIKNGDYVLVDPGQAALGGDLIVIVTQDRQMLKQIGKVTEDEIELKSYNKEYPPIYVKKDMIEKVLRVVYHQPKGKKF